MKDKLKFIIKSLRKSDDFFSDFFSILNSLLFIREKNVFCSNTIRFINEGRLKCEGNFLLGVRSNKIALDYNSKGAFRIAESADVTIGKNVRVARGSKFYITGNLSIGSNTYINPNANVVVSNNLYIGENCAISWNCQILDDDQHVVIADGKELKRKGDITIGNHVWIGSNVTILKGVTIGDNSIIASGSIVTKDIKNNVLAGGIPAKVLREGINWK